MVRTSGAPGFPGAVTPKAASPFNCVTHYTVGSAIIGCVTATNNASVAFFVVVKRESFFNNRGVNLTRTTGEVRSPEHVPQQMQRAAARRAREQGQKLVFKMYGPPKR